MNSAPGCLLPLSSDSLYLPVCFSSLQDLDSLIDLVRVVNCWFVQLFSFCEDGSDCFQAFYMLAKKAEVLMFLIRMKISLKSRLILLSLCFSMYEFP